MRRAAVLAGALICCGVMLAAAGEMPNPLKNAKVGDWLLYEMPGGMQQKQTVVAVSAEAVKVKMDTIINGNTINSMEMDLPLKAEGGGQPVADGPKPKLSDVTMKVKGKDLSCTQMEVEAQGVVTRTWVCADVPISGVVKAETGGSVAMELVDYGRQ